MKVVSTKLLYNIEEKKNKTQADEMMCPCSLIGAILICLTFRILNTEDHFVNIEVEKFAHYK